MGRNILEQSIFLPLNVEIAVIKTNSNIYNIMAQSKNNEDLMERGESASDQVFTPELKLGSPTSTITALELTKEIHGAEKGKRRGLSSMI
jgi:hypothetical protein